MQLKDHGYYRVRLGGVIEVQRISKGCLLPYQSSERDTHICIKELFKYPNYTDLVGETWLETGMYMHHTDRSALDLVEEVSEEEVIMLLLGAQK